MSPRPGPGGFHRPPSDREVMAHARRRRRQRRRWFRAWLREGMPGYWDVYEGKCFSRYLDLLWRRTRR